MNPIKNRAYNRPRSINGATPDHWTITNVGGAWGAGKTWASGVYRATGGGPLPEFGDRCLLLGAADAAVSTDAGSEILISDSSTVSQVVAGAAFRGAESISVDCWVADVGADKGNTRLHLKISDGLILLTSSRSFSPYSDGTRVTITRQTTSLDTTKDWTVSIALARTDSTATGTANALPRVYVSRMFARWAPYSASPPRILRNSENLMPDATVTSSSAATGYAASNVGNGRAGAPLVTNAGTSAWVEADLGSAQAVNLVAMVGMNLTEGDTITIDAGAFSPPSTLSITVPTNNLVDAFAEFTTATYRYWRVTFGGTSKQWQVGEIVLGLADHLQRGYQWGASHGRIYSNSNMATSYDQLWSYQRSVHRSFSMAWGDIDLEDAEELLAIIADCKGDALPLTIVPDPAGYDVFFGQFAGGQFSKVERSLRSRSMGQLEFRQQAKAVVQS